MSRNVPAGDCGDMDVDRSSASPGGDADGIEPIPHVVGEGGECDHVVGHLWEYLDSEMTEDDAARMRAHLAHCSPCLAELSLDELVRQLLRRSCADRAPATLRARLYAQFSATAVITRGS